MASVAVLALLPMLFLQQKTRVNAWCFIFAFYLILNIEEILDVAHFFHWHYLVAIGVWMLHALLFSLIWLPFYKPLLTPTSAFIRTTAFTIILMLPPFGFFIWMQPIIASGILFPGCGWWGLLAAIVLIALLATFGIANNNKTIIFILFFLSFVSFLSNLLYHTPIPDSHWAVINTRLGEAKGNVFSETNREAYLIQQTSTALDQGKTLIVLPENMARWLPGTDLQWQSLIAKAKRHRAHILLGVTRWHKHLHESGFEVLGERKAIFLPERMPMPLGEWRPWSYGNYVTHWSVNENYTLPSFTLSYLICYEQMVPLPFLLNFLNHHSPTIVISGANQWFALPSSYIKQQIMMRSFTRLFRVPLLIATNR